MKRKILITATNYSRYCAGAKALLESHGFEIVENGFGRPMTFEELKERVSDIYGVVVGVDTWDEEVFKLAPQLKVMARFGVGVDNIDLEKAKEYGIQVTNARGMNANAVAEMAVGLILGITRNIPCLDNSLRRGNWDRFLGKDIAGKKVGLLGFGAIAQLLARKLQGFDVNLYAYDKYPNLQKAEELKVAMTGMEEILRSCDIVSMHLPSSGDTYRIMGKAQFDMMKDGAYFINTARGALVDEKALYDALKAGKLTGAATDVYEEEPAKPENPLFELDNILCTPHTAAETYETYTTVSLATARAILDVSNGKIPENLLNG